MARDFDTVGRAFAGARRADPTFDFFRVAPDNGNRLAVAWATPAPLSPPLGPLPDGDWWVDGRASREAPRSGVATWLQRFEDGRPTFSAWAPDGTGSVALPAPVAPLPAPPPPAPAPVATPSPRTALLVGAVSAGALGAASLGTAFAVHQGVARGTLDPDRRAVWQPVNQVTGWAAPLLGATSLGLGVAALAVGR